MKFLSTVWVAAILVAGAWTVCVRADEPPSIDGTWEIRRFDKATGQEFAGLKLILESDGDVLRGTAVWPDGKETPIAAGRITGGRLSFKVTPGSMIQDYGGEFDGGVIRGRWAVSIASFDWEARRAAADVAAEQLYGRWTFEHGALGEFDTLELQRDGRFRLEHRDVALGTTATSGTWSLEGGDVVLRQERHEVDGQEFRGCSVRTEKLQVRETADGLRLGKPLREFQRESPNQGDAPETPRFTPEHDVTWTQGRQEAFAGIDVEVDRRRGTPALRFDGMYAVRVEQEEWCGTTAQEMWREYQEGQFAVLPTEWSEWVSLDGKLPIVIYLGGVGLVEVREYSDGDPLTVAARFKLVQFPLGLYPPSEAVATSPRNRGAAARGAEQGGEPFRDLEQQFTGVSDKRSFEAALSEALRGLDRAVADQAQSPCSRVEWRLVEIRGTSGTPAGLNRMEVKIAASFEGALKLAWGEPGPDLRMAVGIHPRDALRSGDLLQAVIAIQNTGEHQREIVGHLENLLPQCHEHMPVVRGDRPGKSRPAVRMTLAPGETATVHRFAFRVRPLEELAGEKTVEEPTLFLPSCTCVWRPRLKFRFPMVPEETHHLSGPAVQLPILSSP